MSHTHINKVLESGYKLVDGDMLFTVKLYGCTTCDLTSTEPLPVEDDVFINHNECGPDCFGCKARLLQLSPGDAAANKGMSQKKWDAELNAYASARKQGIQPAGTSMRTIEDALKKSDKAGKAFDASTNGYKG